MAAADPAIVTGQRLAALLAARGVRHRGRGETGRGAGWTGREIAHVDSPPLSTIVGEMLTSSDNYTAEELLRDVAVGSAGRAPATTAMGVQIVERRLGELGVPTNGLDHARRLRSRARATAPPAPRMLEVIELVAPSRGSRRSTRGWRSRREPGRSPFVSVAGRSPGGCGPRPVRSTGSSGSPACIDRPDDLHFAFIANGDFSEAAGLRLQDRGGGGRGRGPGLRVPADLVPNP